MTYSSRGLLKGRWSLAGAFLVGAIVGVIVGAAWGWMAYGTFEIGYLSNHVLGSLFIFGFVFLGLAALRNWLRRNPL